MFFPNRRIALSYLLLLLPPLALTLLAFATLARVDEARIVAGAPLEALPTPTTPPAEQAAAYLQVGADYQAQGDFPAAEQAYRAALAVQPELAAGYGGLGSLYVAAGRSADAIALYQQATALAPETAEWWRNLGVVQANQGDLAAAAVSLERAVDLAGQEAAWRLELGQVYAAMQRPDEARRAFQQALALDASLQAVVEEQLRLLAPGP
jgi:tetratricopeptide (TPR) repeat protein